MATQITKGSTTQPLPFILVGTADHLTGQPGKTPTVTIRKQGGAFAAPSGAVVEVGNGWYEVSASAANYDTLGSLILHATAAGCDPVDREFEIVPDPRGPGSILTTHNIAKGDSTPVAGAQVWITTGTNPAAGIVWGPVASDAMGDVPILLDPGTYYRWVQLAGYTFTNPQPFTVAATPATQTFDWTDAVVATAAPPLQTIVTGPRKASVTITYDPAVVTAHPQDPTPGRSVKLGFVKRPSKLRLRIVVDSAKDYRDYKLWGPLIGESAWRTLPDAESDGAFVVEPTMDRSTVLGGETAEPFALANGNKLVIATATDAATYAQETVTFATGGFVVIGQATAAEVAASINSQCLNVTAAAVEKRVVITGKQLDSFLQVASVDNVDYVLGFGPGNSTTIYDAQWRGNSSKLSRVYLGVRKEGASGANEVAWDWLVRDEVVPIIPSDVRTQEWFGIPLVMEDGRSMPDDNIWRMILSGLDELERDTRTRLTPFRVISEPSAWEPTFRQHFDYDLGESAYDYDYRSNQSFWQFQLREYPLVSFERFEFRDFNRKSIANMSGSSVPNLETGHVRLVPTINGQQAFHAWAVQQSMMFYAGNPLPKWIWVRYTAGPRGGVLDHNTRDICGKMAWVKVARIVSDAITRGLVSVSISDGAVSQSKSTSASSQTSLFGGRITQYLADIAEFKKSFRDRQKGARIIFV